MMCPNCGYCPHCGRGYGVYPRPWYQPTYWYGNAAAAGTNLTMNTMPPISVTSGGGAWMAQVQGNQAGAQ
jgi:hypothetical protein